MRTIHPTKGIVIRTVKYGDTSLICSLFTEQFGLQSYLLQGVRASGKRGMGVANLYQPPAILSLDVYHQPLKSLQRIKEARWAYVYQSLFQDIAKNAVALFMVELIQKCIREPEPNADLYGFLEDVFLHLDQANQKTAANMGLWFALQLAGFMGFRLENESGPGASFLDLRAGSFVEEAPLHPQYAGGRLASLTDHLLQVQMPTDLIEVEMNQGERRQLLQLFEQFYALHVPEFGKLRTLPVLQTIFD